MLIIAGALYVDAADRDRYLAATFDVARQARAHPGCLDFVQAADPLDPTRINVYERWDSEDDLLRFRGEGTAGDDAPAVRSADVARYTISSVGAP